MLGNERYYGSQLFWEMEIIMGVSYTGKWKLLWSQLCWEMEVIMGVIYAGKWKLLWESIMLGNESC